MGTPSVLHTRSLNCSLIMLQKNLAPWTPLDIIIVAPPETIERDGFPSWLSRWENLYLVAQPDPPPPDGVAEELAKNSYMRICSWCARRWRKDERRLCVVQRDGGTC